MAADALAPSVARTSAAMVLIMHDKQVLAFHVERISIACTTSVLTNDTKCDYMFTFILHYKG